MARLLPRFLRRWPRRRGGLKWLLVLLLVGWALHRLDLLPQVRRPEGAATQRYDREDWPHWSDSDHDCQDTRQEVLIAESEVPVRFRDDHRCTVARGRWRCPYTGRVITDPGMLDVDHLVPLHEAHRSGGHAWSRERRERYANELEEPAHLVAVARGANRSKGDKAPHLWMPSNADYRCEYLRQWLEVKERWSLELEEAERRYIEEAQRDCARGRVPPRPRAARG